MSTTSERVAPKGLLNLLITCDAAEKEASDSEQLQKIESDRAHYKRLLPAALLEAIEQQDFLPKDLKPGFDFYYEDMAQLLKAYYFGAKRGWLSYLHRQDMTDRTSTARAILYNPELIPHGNPLLKLFTHRQVDWAVRQLLQRSVVREGQSRAGWHEYCLRVLVGKAKPEEVENATQPEVRDEDKVRAMVVLSQILAPVLGNIDRKNDLISKRLQTLFEKLEKK